MTDQLRGADIVARTLDRAGMHQIFTLSGNHIMEIFDATIGTDINLTHVRQEGAAVLMAGRQLPWLSIPIALTIGTIGTVSVFYAVYIQKRSIKCACVGGSGNVPLGFVSLTENLAMVGMGIWMLLRPAV